MKALHWITLFLLAVGLWLLMFGSPYVALAVFALATTAAFAGDRKRGKP